MLRSSSAAVATARDERGIAADGCVLFLWAIAPILPQALETMTVWGFPLRFECRLDQRRNWSEFLVSLSSLVRDEEIVLEAAPRGVADIPTRTEHVEAVGLGSRAVVDRRFGMRGGWHLE